MPADRSWVAFTLRPQARFHDGSPITVEDVIWTFDALKTKGRPFYRSYYAQVAEGREGGRAQGALRVRARGEPRAAADRRPAARAVARLLEQAGLREDDARAAPRQRAVPGRGPRSRPLHHLPPGEGLLGREAARERGPGQLRLAPLRLLPRLHGGDRGAQGRRVRLPPGERGQELGDRVRDPGGHARAPQEGGDPERGPDRHAGVRLQHAAADLPGSRASAARSATRSTSSGATRTSSTAPTRAPRATSRTRSSRRAACRAARS